MSNVVELGQEIWKPSEQRVKSSKINEFLQAMSTKHGFSPDWNALYHWSITDVATFWFEASEFLNIIWDVKPKSALEKVPEKMENQNWFPETKLNYAKNLLEQNSDKLAILSYLEGREEIRWTRDDLYREVSRISVSLKKMGVAKGDRVCGVLVNGPHAIACMLASASLGAVWSSSSPDFGYSGIVDRFKQIDPKVMFFSKSYMYGGKTFDCVDVAEKVTNDIPTLEKTVIVDHFNSSDEKSVPYSQKNIHDYNDFLDRKSDIVPIEFESCDFLDPLFIMFSSGTTGIPKCIVHSVGGTLLQHKKELALHTDLKEDDKLFYFTTCGWMMWNWMVSALSVGSAVVTYDGSVALNNMSVLWEIVKKEGVKAFGTSPKFMSACMKAGFEPKSLGDFSKLEAVLSTGAPLLPEHYSWIYEQFPKNLQLASISGGTDIISCFMLGNPLLPVRVGEIQSPGLGMAVESWKTYGEPVIGEKAELVCVKPFVSMPTGFWKDSSGEKYRKAYFDFYTEDDAKEKGMDYNPIWRHGDFIEMSRNGGVVVYGRSDATLNPGGVRIGTAEIYRTVESLDDVMDSLVVGYPVNGDVEVVLFVKCKNSTQDDTLVDKIKKLVRSELTPRHVPAKIFMVNDVPYTRSGKKVELAVLGALQGNEATNKSALTNPESLDQYYNIGIDNFS
jgi:acetoacetyl-CoA synthetase